MQARHDARACCVYCINLASIVSNHTQRPYNTLHTQYSTLDTFLSATWTKHIAHRGVICPVLILCGVDVEVGWTGVAVPLGGVGEWASNRVGGGI